MKIMFKENNALSPTPGACVRNEKLKEDRI